MDAATIQSPAMLLATLTAALLSQPAPPSPPPLPLDLAEANRASPPPPPPQDVPSPPPSAAPTVVAAPSPTRGSVLEPARGAVLFAPTSLFGLSLAAELELALPAGLSFFVGLSGGLLGQLSGEAGLRYAVLGTALEGAFVDARGAAFSLPGRSFTMVGPGVGVGYSWRVRGVIASVGVGATMWWTVQRDGTTGGLTGSSMLQSFFVGLPGLIEPPTGRNAAQPTIRLSFGPTF